MLATKCDYDDMVDVYIRDQFVFHCYEEKIQERLLSCKNPSLQEVIDIAKGIERSIESSKELAATMSPKTNVYALQERRKYGQQSDVKSNSLAVPKSFICYRCGSKLHKADFPSCPAIGKKCTKCFKIGHFAGVCKHFKPGYSKNVKVSNIDDVDEEMCSNIVLTLGDVSHAKDH